MPKTPNLRTMTCNTEQGSDVKDTGMLKGKAEGKTKAEGEKNSTVQSVGSAKPSGPYGGEATYS